MNFPHWILGALLFQQGASPLERIAEIEIDRGFGAEHFSQEFILQLILDVSDGEGADADRALAAGGVDERCAKVTAPDAFDAERRDGVDIASYLELPGVG